MDINFRPHHFLCALCFQGKGYSNKFVDNFTQIMQTLKSSQGDLTQIHVVSHTDSICDPCPHKQGDNCASQEKIIKLDQAHASILGLKAGDVITWKDAKKRIRKNMSLDKFHGACKFCQWKKFGMCESVLTQFIAETDDI